MEIHKQVRLHAVTPPHSINSSNVTILVLIMYIHLFMHTRYSHNLCDISCAGCSWLFCSSCHLLPLGILFSEYISFISMASTSRDMTCFALAVHTFTLIAS